MRRTMILAYGLFCYLICLGTFGYSMGFLGNVGVPKSIDSAPLVSLGNAMLINSLLLALFAVQHSVMARPAFKRWWTRIVPEPAERATYVLFSCLALIALFVFWEPMGGIIWDISSPVGVAVAEVLYVAGWTTVLVVTFLINHFDLFGVRQVWMYFRGQQYVPLGFVTPGPYKLVRHPLYIGWLLCFWATPTMTAAHLTFAILTTAYILVAIQFEERDLVGFHGQKYAEYRRSVPMLIPGSKRRAPETAPAA